MYIFWTILGVLFLFLDSRKKSILNLTLASTFLFCAIIAYKFPQNHFYQLICALCFGGIFYTMITTSIKREEENNKKEKNL